MSETTATTLLLDLNTRMGEISGDIGKLMAGIGHLGERQRELAQSVDVVQHDISAIEGRLAVGSERHRDFAASLDTIDVRTNTMQIELNKITPLAITVADIEPKVKDMVEFKGRIAAIMMVTSAIVGAALWFIWEGLKWIFPDAGRELFHKIFH